MAQEFAAILLVCLASMPHEQCTEASAADVRSTVVANELGCVGGWQEMIARVGDGDRGPAPTYLKTVCRRVRPN